MRLRSVLPTWVPGWAQAGEGGKLLSVLGALLDAAHERMRQALRTRFPSYAAPDALKLLGEDRLITRGRDEPRERYAARLVAYRYPGGHRTRGNSFSLLEQVSSYLGGMACSTVDRRGNRFYRSANGGETFDFTLPPYDWDGAPVTPRWARAWWVLLPAVPQYRIHQDWGAPGLFDWGDGTALGGRGISPEDFSALRALSSGPHPWRMAGARDEWIVVAPAGVTPAEPDGLWGRWGKPVAGQYVPARDPACRYIAIRPELKEYPGDPEAGTWLEVQLPGGAWAAGDPAATAWGAVALPGGSVMLGDAEATTWAATLPDDGDPV